MEIWREFQEDPHKIKTILTNLNTHLVDKSTYMIERDVDRSRLTHAKFRKNRWKIINMPSQGFLNFYLTNNKMKVILKFCNRQFEAMSHFPYYKNPYVKRGAKLLIWSMLLAYTANVTYREYTAQEYSKRFNAKLRVGATGGLANITSKQVLYSEQVLDETGKLIHRICSSPRTQYQVGNLLGRVIQSRPIVTNTDKLAWKFIHTNLIHEQSSYNKLKGQIINQLRNPDRREDLKKIFLNWAKSEGARDNAVGSWVGSFKGPTMRALMIEKSKKSISNTLENEQTKQNLKEKVDSYLG